MWLTFTPPSKIKYKQGGSFVKVVEGNLRKTLHRQKSIALV